jgi:hypothetical protein
MMKPNDIAAKASTAKTPAEIAAAVSEMLKAEKFVTVTLNDRREMDRVVDYLTYEEKKRVRFNFHG